jgi:hypothetical protein
LAARAPRAEEEEHTHHAERRTFCCARATPDKPSGEPSPVEEADVDEQASRVGEARSCEQE